MKISIRIILLGSLFFMAISCSSTQSALKSKRDGSSYEKAVKVESVKAEYDYVRRVCSDCKILGQSLASYKHKHYDILKLEKNNGDKVSYYFDISKFYGKFPF